MKKIVLSLISFLTLALSMQASIITISKKGGGSKGFMTVTESHTCNTEKSVHTLTCIGAGNKAAEWNKIPATCNPSEVIADDGVSFSTQELLMEAEAEIKAGNLKGKKVVSAGVLYTWEGNKKGDITFIIKSGIDFQP